MLTPLFVLGRPLLLLFVNVADVMMLLVLSAVTVVIVVILVPTTPSLKPTNEFLPIPLAYFSFLNPLATVLLFPPKGRWGP